MPRRPAVETGEASPEEDVSSHTETSTKSSSARIGIHQLSRLGKNREESPTAFAERLEAWTSNTKRALRRAGVLPHEYVDIAVGYLEDEPGRFARNWLDDWEKEADNEETGPTPESYPSWKHFVGELHQEFGVEDKEWSSLKQLAKTHQGQSETLVNFIARFRRLARDAGVEEEQKMLIMRFIEALQHDKIREAVAKEKPTQVEKAYEAARREDRAIQATRAFGNNDKSDRPPRRSAQDIPRYQHNPRQQTNRDRTTPTTEKKYCKNHPNSTTHTTQECSLTKRNQPLQATPAQREAARTHVTAVSSSLSAPDNYHHYPYLSIVPPEPQNFFDITVDGRPTIALADTGATISCISPEYVAANNLQMSSGPTYITRGYQPAEADAPQQNLGWVTAHLQIELNNGATVSTTTSLPVLPIDSRQDLIVGRNLLKYWNLLDADSLLPTSTPRTDPGKPEIMEITVEEVLAMNDSDRHVVFIHKLSEESVIPLGFEIASGQSSKETFQRLKFTETQLETSRRVKEKLLQEYPDVFVDELPDEVPPSREVEHIIEIDPSKTLKRSPMYAIPKKYEDLVLGHLVNQLEKGFYSRWFGDGDYAAPIVIVHKQGGSPRDIRLCMDFSSINEATIKSPYPVPDMTDVITRMRDCSFFSSIDLKASYNQIRIADESKKWTAFKCKFGTFICNVMPFGLSNAGATLSKTVDYEFQDYLGRSTQPPSRKDKLGNTVDIAPSEHDLPKNPRTGFYNFIANYFDDLFIFTKTLEEMTKCLHAVAQRLRWSHLFAKKKKIQIALPAISVVGRIVSHNQVAMDPEKIQAVIDYPIPTSLSATRAFLGFVGFFRDHIRHFADIASPITSIMSEGKWHPFEEEQIKAFRDLKNAVISAPVLAIPDFGPDATFDCHIDASKHATGGMLVQNQHPVAFSSIANNDYEKSYPPQKLELNGIRKFLRKWRKWLLGFPLAIFSDHRSLSTLPSQFTDNAQMVRWKNELAEFNITKIEYKPGKEHRVPDALSRAFSVCPISASLSFGDDWISTVKSSLPDDPFFGPILAALNQEPNSTLSPKLVRLTELIELKDGLLYYCDGSDSPPRLCVPRGQLTWDLLRQAHDNAAHLGSDKTIARVSKEFYWPKIQRDIKRFVAACPICQRAKKSKFKELGIPVLPDVPTERWTKVGIDFKLGLPPSGSEKFTGFLTIIDHASRRAHLVPCHDKITAAETARLLVRELYRLHGLPQEFVLDRDSRWMSKFFKAFTQALGTRLSPSTAYHPQSNAVTERVHDTFTNMLKCWITEHPRGSWHDQLPIFEFEYNSSIQTAIGTTPFYRDAVFQPRSILSSLNPASAQSTPAVEEMLSRLEAASLAARDELEVARTRTYALLSEKRKPCEFKPGDLVKVDSAALMTKAQREKMTKRKLSPAYVGPFRIIRKVNANAYEIDLEGKAKAHNVINISFLLPYHIDPAADRPYAPPPDIIMDDDGDHEEFEVERILDHQDEGDDRLYLVRWLGYSPDDDTWEPARNLANAQQAVDLYLQSLPKPSSH